MASACHLGWYLDLDSPLIWSQFFHIQKLHQPFLDLDRIVYKKFYLYKVQIPCCESKVRSNRRSLKKQPNGSNTFSSPTFLLWGIYLSNQRKEEILLWGQCVCMCIHLYACVFVCVCSLVCLCTSVFCERWVALLFNGSQNAMEESVRFLALGHSRAQLSDCHLSRERPA